MPLAKAMPEIDAPGTSVWSTRFRLNAFEKVRRCRQGLPSVSAAFTSTPESMFPKEEKLYRKGRVPLDGGDRTIREDVGWWRTRREILEVTGQFGHIEQFRIIQAVSVSLLFARANVFVWTRY